MSKKNKNRRNPSLRLGDLRKKKFVPKEQTISPLSDYVLTNEEEIEYLSRYILDYPEIETGGQLFGYWTFDGKPVVLFVLGPGPKAGHYNTFFMQDIDYLCECARILKQIYGLDHIGEWHSHHQLGLSRPSGHDANNIATNMRKLGYEKFLLCIGNCTFSSSTINAYMFYSNKEEFEHIPWVVKNISSPFRKITFKENIFSEPITSVGNMKDLFVKGQKSTNIKINYAETYWLKVKENSIILKNILGELKKRFPQNDYIPQLDGYNEVHIEVTDDGRFVEDIHFPNGFPKKEPIILNGQEIISNKNYWDYNGDILNSFINYYKKIKID